MDPGGTWTLGRKASALAAGSGPGGGSSGFSDGFLGGNVSYSLALWLVF